MNINKKVKAVAVFLHPPVTGYVTFQENADQTVTVKAYLSGLPPNKKLGWHIHQFGDLRDLKSCQTVGSHYNPHDKNHGGPHGKSRHVGDLGNLKSNSQGKSTTSVRVKGLKLSGKYSVLGRALVIHSGEDDMGLGGNKDSLLTGNSGKRLGCAVIGVSQ